MRQRSWSRLALLSAAVLVAAGCSTASVPSSSTTTTSAAPSVASAAPPVASAAASTSPAGGAGAASTAPGSFDPSQLPPPEVTSIKIAIGGVDPDTSAIKVALDTGLFKKYGLDAQYFQFNGATQTIQAMVAKQVDVVTSTSTQTISLLGTQTPAVDIAVLSTKLPDYLYAAKGLKTAADLKGKKAAISTLGSQAYQEVIVGMQQLGLKPTDMVITPIGGQSARVAALESGTVAIAAADPGLAPKLAADGIYPIVKLADLTNIEFAGSNVMLLKSFVDANPNTTLRIAAAVLEAVNLPFTGRLADVVKSFAQTAGLSEADSQSYWDLYMKAGIMRDPRASDQAYEEARTVLAALNPQAASFDLSKAHDFSFLDKLKSLGLYAPLGIPTTP